MELLKEILIKILCKDEMQINFPNLKFDIRYLLEIEIFKDLEKIKSVIDDDSLSDFDCIEKIVCVFEEMGSGTSRHDF